MLDPHPVPARMRRFIVGNGSGAAFSLTHGLDTVGPIVQVYQAHEPFLQVTPSGIQVPTHNEVVVHFATPPAIGEYLVVIVG